MDILYVDTYTYILVGVIATQTVIVCISFAKILQTLAYLFYS